GTQRERCDIQSTKDVAFKVLYCGICHSYLHGVKNEWGTATYPMVLGYYASHYFQLTSTKFSLWSRNKFSLSLWYRNRCLSGHSCYHWEKLCSFCISILSQSCILPHPILILHGGEVKQG
ncbi:putative mannitol dehydrogenase, partial [Mucuna pruriens]